MRERFDFSDNGHDGETFLTTTTTPTTEPSVEDATDMVTSFMRTTGHPVSRSEVTTALGITSKVWSSTIRTLLSTGAVVQHGTKKGAKYTLAG